MLPLLRKLKIDTSSAQSQVSLEEQADTLPVTAPRTTDEDLPTLMRRVYLAYYQEYFDMMQALDVDLPPGRRRVCGRRRRR